MATLAWVLFTVAVAACCSSIKAVGRGQSAPSLRTAALWSAGWTALAVAFTGCWRPSAAAIAPASTSRAS